MKLPRLGVNIDHVATIRNARGENYPSPLRAAILVEKYGANSVTIHSYFVLTIHLYLQTYYKRCDKDLVDDN